MIIDAVFGIMNNVEMITGELDNQIFMLHIEEVYCFFSDEKYNYALTRDGNFRVRLTLYELEQNLNKNNWIRISNSSIVNINHIKYFDVGTVGSIVIVLEDGTRRDVAKRRLKEISKLLKSRRGLK